MGVVANLDNTWMIDTPDADIFELFVVDLALLNILDNLTLFPVEQLPENMRLRLRPRRGTEGEVRRAVRMQVSVALVVGDPDFIENCLVDDFCQPVVDRCCRQSRPFRCGDKFRECGRGHDHMLGDRALDFRGNHIGDSRRPRQETRDAHRLASSLIYVRSVGRPRGQTSRQHRRCDNGGGDERNEARGEGVSERRHQILARSGAAQEKL